MMPAERSWVVDPLFIAGGLRGFRGAGMAKINNTKRAERGAEGGCSTIGSLTDVKLAPANAGVSAYARLMNPKMANRIARTRNTNRRVRPTPALIPATPRAPSR